MAKYIENLDAGIGRPIVSTSVSNSFPMVGQTVILSASSKWAQHTRFDLRTSPTSTQVYNIDNVNQKVTAVVPISGEGDLKQKVTVTNSLSQAYIEQYIYSILPRTDPYFNIEVTSEVTRTNESLDIIVRPEMGYDLSRVKAAVTKIFVENTEEAPVKVFNNLVYSSVLGGYHVGDFNINKRGYYDVEVQLTDVNGTTITKRVNKLITISPRLAARPTQEQIDSSDYTVIVADPKYGSELKMYETGVNDLYCIFDLKEGQTDNDSGYLQPLYVSNIPAGKDAYTIVLRKDMSYKEGFYYTRILIAGSTDIYKTNANGTPQFSYDIPLVFTIDQPTPLVLWGIYYSTVNYLGCVRNTVWDGKGYYNLSKGIKFDRYSTELFWEDAFMLLNGTSDVELFELEICNTGFTAIMTKTDPVGNNPWFWYGNFIYYNFVWHHCYIHDTAGEGCYLGYFTPEYSDQTYTGETVTFKNIAGEDVTYEKGKVYKKAAHQLWYLRLFRNVWERNGYDSVQISNSRFSEFSYCITDFSSFKNEKDQASGASLQSMDGLIYNNIVKNYKGPAFQLGPYSDLVEVFNNISLTFEKTDAIQFLWSTNCWGQNPSGLETGGVNDTTTYLIHNNVFIAGRYTANGRNTVQMNKIFFIDNLLVNGGTTFSNMTAETLALWESQKEGNAIYTMEEFLTMQETLKIADMYNLDFRLTKDSPLAFSGTGKYFKMDFRGYKNWFSDVFPTGSYMGLYKRPTVNISGLTILNKTEEIIAGVQLELQFTPEDTTEKKIRWNSSDSSIVEVSQTGTVVVKRTGNATISVTSVNNPSISDSFSCSCIYKDPPTGLSITSNREEVVYLGDVVSSIATVTPSTAIQMVQWSITGGETLENITGTSVDFTPKTLGAKTLTAIHRDYGEVRASKSFRVVERPVSSTVRIAYGNTDDKGGASSTNTYLDGTNIIGYLGKGAKYSFKDVSGTTIGEIEATDTINNILPIISFLTSIPIPATKGFTTVQLKNCTYQSSSSPTTVRQLITGIKGTYKVSIFISINYSKLPEGHAVYNLYAGGELHVLTASSITNNTSVWLEKEVNIGDDGLIIEIGHTYNQYLYIPLNAITIEPV